MGEQHGEVRMRECPYASADVGAELLEGLTTRGCLPSTLASMASAGRKSIIEMRHALVLRVLHTVREPPGKALSSTDSIGSKVKSRMQANAT